VFLRLSAVRLSVNCSGQSSELINGHRSLCILQSPTDLNVSKPLPCIKLQHGVTSGIFTGRQHSLMRSCPVLAIVCLLISRFMGVGRNFYFIYLYKQRTYWPKGQCRVNKPLMCGQKKINKRIHKTLEINYNFPSKVYEKSKVRSIDLNTDKLFSWSRAAGKFGVGTGQTEAKKAGDRGSDLYLLRHYMEIIYK